MDADARIEVFDSPVCESRERVFKAFEGLHGGRALELVTSYDPSRSSTNFARSTVESSTGGAWRKDLRYGES